ncbi:MAG: histidine phosphatase family protein [Psychrobacter sp.]|nr:histidine phosphatase family protein [Psychrobacter sp.]
MIVHIWRHPKPIAAEGFCIGQTDLSVDRRKLKRLANKIQRFVRLHRLPKVIWVSPLQRSLRVGQILAQRGFECRVSKEHAEIDFGIWDGQSWAQIEKQEIDDWCDNFAHFAPDNGESLQQLFNRAESWLNKVAAEQNDMPVLAIGHAGWINAAKMIAASQEVPKLANEWPRPVGYQSCSRLEF